MAALDSPWVPSYICIRQAAPGKRQAVAAMCVSPLLLPFVCVAFAPEQILKDMDQEERIKDIEARPMLYEISELGAGGMASVSQGGSMWLLRRQAAPGGRLLPLVIDGDVVFITEADIEPKAVEAIKRHCPWLMLKAHYRFWVFPFGPDGLAAVEWTVQPDGRSSADEDGFGMDDGVEVILHGSIDVEGRPAGQFRLYERK